MNRQGQPGRSSAPLEWIEIKGEQGLRIVCSTRGASWLSCQVPVGGDRREVLLGGSTPSNSTANSYMGATVGRYANRIARGQFTLGSRPVRLETNQGCHTLHGGPSGFDRRCWHLAERTPHSVLFELESPDGDQGFPGNLQASARYTVTAQQTVQVTYRATTDSATPVNLSNHAYFNLLDASGGSRGLEHRLQIHADHYLPVDAEGIPASGLQSVEATPFDFRYCRVIGSLSADAGYDHAFLLQMNEPLLARPALSLIAPDDSLKLQVFTTKPALQLYTGRWLEGTVNRSGTPYPAFAGIALETQFLPDSPNHPEWQPSCILRPGEIYSHTTEFSFLTGDQYSASAGSREMK